MRIGVFCNDSFLFQKIKLILSKTAECVRLSKNDETDGLALILAEGKEGDVPFGALRMARDERADLRIPFTARALAEFIECRTMPRALLSLDFGSKSALFKGKSLKLTELEFSLLSLLLSENRCFTREEILERVWTPDADSGIVNVYIHYLREKLESDGERVILSLRGRGYRIDERFLSGGVHDASST